MAYAFPDVKIVTTEVDHDVNENFYILPGLGTIYALANFLLHSAMQSDCVFFVYQFQFLKFCSGRRDKGGCGVGEWNGEVSGNTKGSSDFPLNR